MQLLQFTHLPPPPKKKKEKLLKSLYSLAFDSSLFMIYLSLLFSFYSIYFSS